MFPKRPAWIRMQSKSTRSRPPGGFRAVQRAIISIFRHKKIMAEIQQYKKEQAAAQLQGSLKGKADEISILHYQFAGIDSSG